MTNLLLYQRIAQQLAEDIRRGVYRPGERVPSVRKMSRQLSVSHATVLQAYANLEDQGMIRARPQSGFYVHQTPVLTAPTPDIARVERPTLVTRSSIINQVLSESRREGLIPLGAAVPHVDYLPVRALHQQLAKVTRFQSPRAFSYMFSPGYEPLRRQVAIRMRDAGVVVDPGEIVITHGCVDALQMSLRVLTRPGDLIAAESPTYYGLLQLADLLGLKVIEIPSDPDTGMSLEALQLAAGQWPIKALVLTARLSNPLGVSMPDHRQKQLLNLAARFDIQIVEDDIYGELMFEQDQYKALKSNDRDGRVIDRGLAVRFPGTGSYTGEDCAEFHCHGSPVVLRAAMPTTPRGMRPSCSFSVAKSASVHSVIIDRFPSCCSNCRPLRSTPATQGTRVDCAVGTLCPNRHPRSSPDW